MEKIWIVEDDQNLANLTKLLLDKKGYEVTVFHEAGFAIEEIKRQMPDLILMDIMLPQISGAQAVKIIRKNADFKNIPVIFLTGLITSEEDDVKENGITIDGINYTVLRKPYEYELLFKLIESSLHHKGETVSMTGLLGNADGNKLEGKLKGIKAVDLMSRFAITIKEDETIKTLAHLMMRFKISGVPVCNENGEICGVITATDLFNLMRKMVQEMKKSQDVRKYTEMKVKDFMTSQAITITEKTTLHEMMTIMSEGNIHTLPVVGISNTDIVGVIGRRDVLNAFYSIC
jgi:CheY-like chemotaxis protein